ncbi:MAG: toast rack family protein, partial [Chloroflexota bacterium]
MLTKKFIGFTFIMSMISMACGLSFSLPEDAIKTGQTQMITFAIPAPDSAGATQVQLEFGGGEMIIRPGETQLLLSGAATFNIDKLEPVVTTVNNSVKIEQGSIDYEFTGLPNFGDVENTWDLKFSGFPIALDIRAGAYKGDWEFGDLALQELKIFGGASNVDIAFSVPNRIPMSLFSFTSGFSDVKLLNLANANFSLMNFRGGGGNYILDFSGVLLRDASIEIEGGLGNITVIVPSGVPAVVNVNRKLVNIISKGTWAGTDVLFSHPGEGPSLNGNVDLGAGVLQ